MELRLSLLTDLLVFAIVIKAFCSYLDIPCILCPCLSQYSRAETLCKSKSDFVQTTGTKPFTGALCSEKDACHGENRCGPTGVCLPLPNQDYACHCKPGYSGPQCRWKQKEKYRYLLPTPVHQQRPSHSHPYRVWALGYWFPDLRF